MPRKIGRYNRPSTYRWTCFECDRTLSSNHPASEYPCRTCYGHFVLCGRCVNKVIDDHGIRYQCRLCVAPHTLVLR